MTRHKAFTKAWRMLQFTILVFGSTSNDPFQQIHDSRDIKKSDRYLKIGPGSFGLYKEDLLPNKELKKFLGY